MKKIRLKQIEILVKNYGYVNRRVLMGLNGLGSAQVTRDLAAYKAIAPGNMTLDQVSKTYIRTPGFKEMIEL